MAFSSFYILYQIFLPVRARVSGFSGSSVFNGLAGGFWGGPSGFFRAAADISRITRGERAMTTEQLKQLKILKAIVKIVEYSYWEEMKHYWEMKANDEDTLDHIFESLQEVMKWLKTVPETADLADAYLADAKEYLGDLQLENV
jgi:hypothetical protein